MKGNKKIKLTSDKKQPRSQLLEKHNSLALEPSSKNDQHSPRSNTIPTTPYKKQIK